MTRPCERQWPGEPCTRPAQVDVTGGHYGAPTAMFCREHAEQAERDGLRVDWPERDDA